MDQPLEGRRTERPDPTRYMRKGEGSPGGLKKPAPLEQATGSPQGLIAAARGGPAGASPKGASSSPGSPCAAKPTLFRRMYDRGDLPVRVDQERPGRNGLRWTVGDLAAVDLHHYLPVFVEGLQETQEPYRMLARRGVEELVAAAPPDRLLPVLPQLVMGLRGALKSADPQVIQAGLHALSLLLGSSEAAGPALVPFYRQLLPPLGRHAGANLNIGDAIDYTQASHRGSLGDLVQACLHELERSGGPDAFLHIKYHIPTYESCLRPSRLARKP